MGHKLPRPLSHSSMSMYAECPRKYKFKYIDKIPEKPRHFFSFGQSVHLALEFFYGVKAPPPPSLEEVLAHYRDRWVSAGYKDEAQEAQYFEEGKVLLSNFHRKHVKDFHVPFFVEYQFDLEVDGVPVTGKVDRVDRLPDGCLAILDYKTGKALPADRVQADAQLTLYQLACEQLLGARVRRLTFYHVPSLKEHAVERHDDALVDSLRRRVVGTAEAITQGAFEPKPEETKCRWCDYKPICPVFEPERAAAPAEPGDELAALVDRLGEARERLESAAGDLESAKADLLRRLEAKGYVRAFGSRYQARRTLSEKWEFADKKKVLEILRKAGLYEAVLAPSAPKVEQLLGDPALDPDVRARLTELGQKTSKPDLDISPL